MKKNKKDKQTILIGLGVFLLVIASFFYLKTKKVTKTKPSSSPVPEEIIVQKNGTVKKNGQIVQPVDKETMERTKKEIDSVLSLTGEKAELKSVIGGQIRGEAKRAFSDGKFYYRALISGLNLTEKGFYYESWLKKKDEFISTGRVEVNNLGKGFVYYTVSANRSDYSEAIITLEPEDGNPAPAKHILEGEFEVK